MRRIDVTDYQFPPDTIMIQPYALAIGPFTFDLSGQLPAGDDIASIIVATYLDGVDTTASLISGVPTEVANVITVYFDYPGVALHGTHKLTFEYTLVSGATDEADFYGIMVKDV